MLGFVYKIESDCKRVLYIGSTIKKISYRFSEHKVKKKLNCAIFKYLNDPNYTFSNGCELIKAYEIADRNNLYAYEQLFLNKFKNNINEQNAFGILKKERHKVTSKQWREENKEKIKEQKKEYYEDKKEHILKRTNNYYHNNREKTRQRANKKINCECGGHTTHGDKSKHAKTNRHKIYMECKKVLENILIKI